MHTSEDNQAPTPIKAAVLLENGRPALYLDGQPHAPNLSFLNGDTISYSQPVYDSEIAHIAGAGLHLYSTITRLYFDGEEGLDPATKRYWTPFWTTIRRRVSFCGFIPAWGAGRIRRRVSFSGLAASRSPTACPWRLTFGCRRRPPG